MRQSAKDGPITISIVGAGNRARAYLNALKRDYQSKFKVVAIFDPKQEVLDYFHQEYQVPKKSLYQGGISDFVKLKRISDVVIIATLDDIHFEPAMHAIKMGYDIILEKPICMNLEETIQIGEAGKKHPNQLIAVCHVLRHSPFFKKLKELIDSNVIGRVIDIQHNENVGYYHFAHSYVRGSWRNTEISAPFIVAKSCHDLDILLYLLQKKSIRLSSMGSLSVFNQKNYDPKVMAPRCDACQIEPDCPYSAIKIYGSGMIRSAVFDNRSVETLKNDLKNSNYGRCVYNCDNNVADHQVTIIEFEDGVTATFNLSAFTNKIHRSIKIMGEFGEIRGSELVPEIEVGIFGQKPYYVKYEKLAGGHGGADTGFMRNFMESYLYNKPFDSTLAMSIESHVMAYAAEESRLNNGQMINTLDYHEKHK